jgi:hypothetical protein
MRNQIDVLREVFEEWLMINKFDYDYCDMTLDIYNKVNDKNMELSDLYINFNNKITEKFKKFIIALNRPGPGYIRII